MPTTNARKHTIPLGTEASFTRATLFKQFGQSISDVVPVANVTERAQVVSDLTAEGRGPTSARPLVVIRADARGAHRVEYTYDGAVFLPASGILSFVDLAAATSFGTANPGLLTVGDIAYIGAAGSDYRWTGTAWVRPVTRGSVGVGSPTDASGAITVTHGANGTPTQVLVTDRNAGAAASMRKITVNAISSTQIQFVVFNGGNTLGNNPVSFDWVAYT